MECRSSQSVEENNVDVAETVDPAGVVVLPVPVINDYLSEGPGQSIPIHHLTVLAAATHSLI